MLNEKSQMYPLKLIPNNTLLIHEVFRKTKTGPTVTKISNHLTQTPINSNTLKESA